MASEDTDTETGPPKPALENLRSALDDEIPRLNAYSTEIANIHRTILGARAAAPQIADHVQQEMFRRYDELYQDVHTSFQSIVDRAQADHGQYQADRAQYLQEMELYRRRQGRAENIAELSRGALQAEPTDLRCTADVTEAAATHVSHDVPVQPVSSTMTPGRSNDLPQGSHQSTTRDSRSPGTTPSYSAQTKSSIARRQPRPKPSMTSVQSLTHTTVGDPFEEGQLSAASGQSGPAGTADPNVGTTAQRRAKPIQHVSSTPRLTKQPSSASLHSGHQSQSLASHLARTRTLAVQNAKRPASTPEPAAGPAKRRNVSGEMDQPSPSPLASGLGSGVNLPTSSSIPHTSPPTASVSHAQPRATSTRSLPAGYSRSRAYPSVARLALPPGTAPNPIVEEAFAAQRRHDVDSADVNASLNHFTLKGLTETEQDLYAMLEKPQGWTRQEDQLLRTALSRMFTNVYRKDHIDHELLGSAWTGLDFPGGCFLNLSNRHSLSRRSNGKYMISDCQYAGDNNHKQGRGCFFLTFNEAADPFVVRGNGVNFHATAKLAETDEWKSRTDENGHRYYLFRRLTQENIARAHQVIRRRESHRPRGEEHDSGVAQDTTTRPFASTRGPLTIVSVEDGPLSVARQASGTTGRALITSGYFPTRGQNVTGNDQALLSTSPGGQELVGSAIQGAQGGLGNVIDPAREGETGSRSTEWQAGEEVVEDEDMYDSPLPSDRGI